MCSYREDVEVNVNAFSTSALGAGKWSNLHPGCLMLVKGTILKDAGCTSIAVLNKVMEITCPALTGNPAPVIHLAAIHFTDR
jgi:hypothetical protein